jgi:small subunit ribosomal protein S6
MPLYEHVFLSRQDVSAQQVETLTETFKGILEANGGSVTKIEQWGLKSVAFRIRKNRKAHYTLINIDAPSAAVAELERQQRMNEDVLRILTIRVEALEEGQSAMLQKRDRDDRDGDRGGRFGDRGDRPRSGGFREGGAGGGGFRGDREGGGGGGFRGERRPREDGEGAGE